MHQYRPGTRLYSSVCATEVMVIKFNASGEVRCGGRAMSDAAVPEKGGMDESLADGTLMGKRYVDDSNTLELLCVKPGAGSLSCGEEPLREKATKKLPSSD